MNSFHSGWHLIYTKPRHEKKVCKGLNELNISSFLPTKKTIRTWHDRKKIIDDPLFPSYVFVYLEDLDNYYTGLDADGSLFYVKIGNSLARVSESVITGIQLATGYSQDIEVTQSSFLPGQRLVIREGALAGLSCEVVQYRNKRKLLVRVDLLRRNLLLNLPVETFAAM
jgi:transcriptional antiterminator RfaH